MAEHGGFVELGECRFSCIYLSNALLSVGSDLVEANAVERVAISLSSLISKQYLSLHIYVEKGFFQVVVCRTDVCRLVPGFYTTGVSAQDYPDSLFLERLDRAMIYSIDTISINDGKIVAIVIRFENGEAILIEGYNGADLLSLVFLDENTMNQRFKSVLLGFDNPRVRRVL